ncbi:MAG: hypothetical protein WC071_00745 [Victivallaceae bacterium]
MNVFFKTLLIFIALISVSTVKSDALIVDHTNTRLSYVPPEYIDKARKQFKLAFAHTDYASQIVSGMEALRRKNPVLYNFNWSGRGDALSMFDRIPAGDLGNPDRKAWADRTRAMLNNKDNDRNLVVWAWSDQVSNASEDEIEQYLELMSKLEKEFPKVIFIYMTGHVNGTGEQGNLHKRNEQIREYCRKNGKVLFDFADIESYDPDGKVNYNAFFVKDNGDYQKGTAEENWVFNWIEKNPNHDLELPENVISVRPLSAALKARAFWTMLARLAGWNPASKLANLPIRPVKTESEYLNSPDVIKSQAVKQQPAKTVYSKLFNFTTIGDYSYWKDYGTSQSIIPATGSGLLIPDDGNPAMAVLRKSITANQLDFKASITKGNQLNWYINATFDGKPMPAKGLGGIMNNNGCMLVLDGKIITLPGTPQLKENLAYEVKITIHEKKLSWEINRKQIAKMQLPETALSAKGSVAVGGFMSAVTISSIFVSGEE